MSLESIGELMAAARRGGYAIGYFESWNLESLQGVIDAAEATHSPIIIGFNGEFLSREARLTEERIAWYGALGKASAESASVPCGLILNECSNDEWIKAATKAGFNLVMPSDATASPKEYQKRVVALARLAHRRGVAVEAEWGELPSGVAEFGVPPSGGLRAGKSAEKIPTKVGTPNALTDPDAAARFVERTRVDLLAVSVGNVHILVNGERALDLKQLAALRKRVTIPLVLHGGTGIESDSLQCAIALGVTKVNYGTYLKQRYLSAVRKALAVRVPNPHELLGIGGAKDVMVAGRLAVRDAVMERIPLLGCKGRA